MGARLCLALGFVIALISAVPAAKAQPTCNSAVSPNSPACQSQAVSPLSSDILLGQQATGPTRSNQTVKYAISQIVGGGFPGVFSSLTDSAITGSTQCVQVNSSGVFSGTGSACGGAGSTPGGSSGNIQYNSASAFAGNSGLNYDGTSVVTLGVSGTSVGGLAFNNATSGTITLRPTVGALGSSVITFPVATDTVALLATAQTLTNKTINSSTGSFSSLTDTGITGSTQCLQANSSGVISGTGSACGSGGSGLTVGTTAIASGTSGFILYDNAGVLGNLATAGSGSVVLATSPTITTPTISGNLTTNITGSTQCVQANSGGVLSGTGSACGSGGSSTITIGTTVVSGATSTNILYDNAGVVGQYTVSGTGTAVALTAAPTFTGTLTAASISDSGGITDSGGINTSNASGYKMAGYTAYAIVNYSPSVLNADVLIGPDTPTALVSGEYFDTFIGTGAGQNYVGGSGGEITAIGDTSCQNLSTTATHVTCIGVYSLAHATSESSTVEVGGDSGRNMFGTSGNTGVGSYVNANWFGGNNASVGWYAGSGNAAAIHVTGTITTGDTIPVIVTCNCLSINPTTVTYTVQAGDTTLAILATSIGNALAANSTLLAADVRVSTNATISPGIIVFAHAGTATLGTTMTVTIGTIGGSGTEVLTPSNGVTTAATYNTAMGAFSEFGSQWTTGYYNAGYGGYTLANITTGIQNACGGEGSCEDMTSANNNAVWGQGSFAIATTAYSITSVGQGNGADCTTCNKVTLIGQGAGASGIGTYSSIMILSDGGTCLSNYVDVILVCGGGNPQIKIQNTNQATNATFGFAGNLLVGGFIANATAPFLNGDLAMVKTANTATAPGAGYLKLEILAGTTGGTCKLVAFAGTSATPVTVVDNVGTGC